MCFLTEAPHNPWVSVDAAAQPGRDFSHSDLNPRFGAPRLIARCKTKLFKCTCRFTPDNLTLHSPAPRLLYLLCLFTFSMIPTLSHTSGTRRHLKTGSYRCSQTPWAWPCPALRQPCSLHQRKGPRQLHRVLLMSPISSHKQFRRGLFLPMCHPVYVGTRGRRACPATCCRPPAAPQGLLHNSEGLNSHFANTDIATRHLDIP